MPTYKLGSKTGKGAFSEVISPGLAAGDPEGVKKAKPRPGKVERVAKRETLKGINVELRGARKQSREAGKGINWKDLESSSPGSIEGVYEAGERTQAALSKKADIKDYSTRKRVRKGGRKNVSLLKEPIEARTESGEALYKGGFNQGAQNISGIHGGGGATKTKDTGSENYKNVYTLKGEYKHSIPDPQGADLGDISWPKRPPKTSPTDEPGKPTRGQKRAKRRFEKENPTIKIKKDRTKPKHLKKNPNKGFLSEKKQKNRLHKPTSGVGRRRRAKKRGNQYS